MLIRWLYILGMSFLLAACAKPPSQELHATEYLVARAYGFQAPTYAPDEYQAAFSALEDGRRLIAGGDYPAARAAFAFARQHALRAYSMTETAKAHEAAEAEARLKAEEARRQAEEARKAEEARRKAEETRKAEEVRKAAESRMLTEYRVGSNDTLASIAALIGVYGDPMLWPLLYQANRDQIKDPQHIYVGQTLKIPRGLPASDFDAARMKSREAGLFGLPQNSSKPALPH